MMPLPLLLLVSARLLSLRADTLRGSVTDSAGQPLGGSAVSVPALDRSGRTDSAGRFVLSDLPAGTYALVVRHAGMAPVLRTVTVRGTAVLDVKLVPSAVQLDVVTVSAARTASAPLTSPLPTDELSGEQLQRAESVELSHALEGLPGVRTLSSGESVGKPVLRGLSGPRVLTLDNGARLEDNSWSDEDGPSVDVRLADRVEVIRGPASVLYGSDAIGGIINVIPDALPDARGRAAFVTGAAEVSGGTNNSELGTLLRAEGGIGVFGWRVTGIGRRASNFRTPPGNDSTPSGVIFDSGYEAVNGEAEIGVQTSRGPVALRYTRYGGDFGLLDGSPAPSDNISGPLRRLSDDRVQLTSSTVLSSALRLETTTQYERHWLQEVVGPSRVGGGAPPPFDEPSFNLVLQSGTADVILHHTLAPWLTGAVGVSGMVQGSVSSGIVPLVPGARDGTAALFLFETATLGRWSFSGGVRGDARWLTATPLTDMASVSTGTLITTRQTRDAQAFSGDVGAVYRVADGLALAANVGRAFRTPTLYELFTNGPHLGEDRYEIGLPSASPEASWNEDLSFRWALERFTGELAVYHNVMAGYLYVAPTGETAPALTDAGLATFPVYRYQQTRAVLDGAEAAGEVAVLPALSVRGRFDLTNGTNRTTGQPLPLMPPARADLGAELHTPPRAGWASHLFDRAYLSATAEIVATQTRLGPFDTPTAGYTVFDLGAGLAGHWAGRPMAIDLSMRNALDRVYADFLSRYKIFAYGQGRNIILRLSTGLF